MGYHDYDERSTRDEIVDNLEKKVRGINIIKWAKWLSIVLILLIIVNMCFYTVDGGEFYIEQSPSGELTAITTPGIKFKFPIVTRTFKYNEYVTITYSAANDRSASSSNPPYPIRFGDTYGGKIEGSFRFRLPTNPEDFVQLHKAVKTNQNLMGNTLNKNANELLQYTAAQFTGVEFMQGGQNEFRNRILDQAQNGLYETKRELVAQNTDIARAGVDVDAGEVHTGQNAIYKNVIMHNSKGEPLRKPSSLNEFGITLVQVTVENFTPDEDLNNYARRKRERLQERAKIVEEQQNEKERAKTAAAKGERERIESKQAALREKDKAEIEAQKALELERIAAEREKVQQEKEKDLAAIRKAKELEIAQKEREIQEAKAIAAKFEAQAIKEKGFAEAEVKHASYNAYNVSLYSLELRRDIAEILSAGLKGTDITMPQFIVGNGNGDVPTNSVSAYMDVIMLDAMRNLGDKTAGPTQ